MSEKDTPETDAFQASGKGYYMACEFARSLERERDEARDALSGRTVSCSQCNQVAAERDEAQKLALDLQDCLEVTLSYFADVRQHFGETFVWDSLVNEDIIEQCEVSLAKSKEVLP
jgi:energy-converting hydrogenase A subunit M